MPMIKGSFRSIAVVVTLAGAFACGKQKFRPLDSTINLTSPGETSIAPKIDLLLVTDDTGSMAEAYSQISAQMVPFLERLEATGWNFHFANVPLTQIRAVSQVSASRHDPNWSAEQIPEVPGSTPDPLQAITAGFFKKPRNFTEFLSYGDINFGLGANEPGLQSIVGNLRDRSLVDSHFYREDALLAIFVVGNGDDTSGVNFCRNVNGIYVPCNDGSAQASFDRYKGEIVSVKTPPPGATNATSRIRFYSAVSNRVGSCLGGRALVGTRYQAMARVLGGKSYDICQNSIQSVVNSLSDELKFERLKFRTRYIILENEPDPASIRISKLVNGDLNNKIDLVAGDPNGFQYVGYQQDIYLLDFPVPMNRASGFAVELLGNGKLVGADIPQVTFKLKSVGGN